MVNSVKILGLLILLTNICIHANVTEDSKALTNEFEFKNRNLEKIASKLMVNNLKKPEQSLALKMIRKLKKDNKKPKQKCVIKMAVCILSVPVKPN